MTRFVLPTLQSLIVLFALNNTILAQGLTKLTAEVDLLIADPIISNGDLGFALMDVSSGKMLLERNASKSLLPASTMKIVTSGAALGILGENFTFKTVLEYDGTIDEAGVLHGNLYIRGGGDPTLGSDRFKWGTDREGLMKAWVQILMEKGIKKIDGTIIGDESIFENALIPTTWVWSDVGNYYGAGACGLTFNENTYYLYFKPGAKVGDPAELIRTDPEIPGIQFVNEMKTGAVGSGDNGYVYGTEYTNLKYLRGTVPMGNAEFSIKGAIPDPSLFCAQSLQKALLEKGVSCTKPAETIRIQTAENRKSSAARNILHTHASPPLKDVVYWINKKSVNLFAEHLLKMCGVNKFKDGTTESGAKAISNYWASVGVDVKGLHVMDGSGLSRYNGVTSKQQVSMLKAAKSQTWFNAYWESMSIAGDPSDVGSLSGMCVGTAAAKNLRGKSGYIMRVRTYTGYVMSKSGKLLAFSVLANNYTCSNAIIRDRLDKLMGMCAEVE